MEKARIFSLWSQHKSKRTVLFLVMCLISCHAVQAETLSPYINHSFHIEGDIPKEIKKKIESLSLTASHKDNTRNTFLAIKRRLVKDQKKIAIYLKSIGYFEFNMKSDVKVIGKKALVVFSIDLGPQYCFGDIRFISEFYDIPEMNLPIETGLPFSTNLLLEAEEKILKELRTKGHVDPKVEDREVTTNSVSKTVSTLVYIFPGHKTNFGETQYVVGDFISRKFIDNRIKWKKGCLFDQENLEESRVNFVKTEVFESVIIKPLPQEENETPIYLNLTESKRHFVGFGLEYSTQDGFGGRAFWGHRNLWGGGERLKLNLEYLQFKRTARADLSMPDILAVDQTWQNTLEISRENFDAYDADLVRFNTGLSKSFGKYTRDFGIAFSREEVRDVNFFLIGLPMILSRDGTESVTDPSSGTFVQIHAEPTKNFVGEKETFTILKSQFKTYFKFARSSRFVLAFNAKTGSIVSEKLKHVPATRLFYIGGANSIRGYQYQYAGPLTLEANPKDRVPIGGRSFAELATELRYRISDEWGAVIFGDMGALSEDQVIFTHCKKRLNPDDGKIFAGLGFGARYYFADLSPVRADIAFPLTRRKDIDKFLQFYISFGHSF